MQNTNFVINENRIFLNLGKKRTGCFWFRIGSIAAFLNLKVVKNFEWVANKLYS